MRKQQVFWSAFGVLALVFAVIQFVPSPPLLVPAQLPAQEREAHRVLNFEGIANFRDLDAHFVAPFQFEGPSTIELRVDCTAAGPNQTNCDVAATIVGFVDQAR